MKQLLLPMSASLIVAILIALSLDKSYSKGYAEGYEAGALNMALYVDMQEPIKDPYGVTYMSAGMREYMIDNKLNPQSKEEMKHIDSIYEKRADSIYQLYLKYENGKP